MRTASRNKRKSPWSSLFFRLFASIMAITAVILLVQFIVVAVMFTIQSRQFENEVFSGYKDRLQQALTVASQSDLAWNLQSIGPVLKMAADDRISGLILRDADGNTVLTFGKTPRGIAIPELEMDRNDPSYMSPPENTWYFSPTISKVYIKTGDESIVQTVVLPEYPAPVREEDIVGTITLYANPAQTEVFGSVDVLVFSPLDYAITALLLRRIVAAFMVTIPIALIIALVGAQVVARAVSRHAGKIVKVLEAVAGGNYLEPVPHSTMDELALISESVELMEHKLASHERMRQQWLRGIAHDLNTPVTALKLSIESALDHVVPLDVTLLQKMKKENEELERRVGAVLMLASMESPDFAVHKEMFDVLDFVDEVINSTLTDHRVMLDVGLDRVSGDRRLLLLVCRELIKNAGKYAPVDTPVRWSIRSGDETGEICMVFSNQGHVAPEILERVFEPWFRADESRSKAGAGMGLAIVRQVMETHNGSVALNQVGDTVVVELRWKP
ncbi:MAG: ATP-binding protein [Sphaerochaetaceae bacterium]